MVNIWGNHKTENGSEKNYGQTGHREKDVHGISILQEIVIPIHVEISTQWEISKSWLTPCDEKDVGNRCCW